MSGERERENDEMIDEFISIRYLLLIFLIVFLRVLYV